MPYATSYIGPIFFVRWKGEVLVTDGLPLEFEVKRYRMRAREQLTMIWIVPGDLKMVVDEARLSLSRAIISVRQYSREFHLVIEATNGFAHSAHRSVFSPSFSSSGVGPTTMLHASTESCLRDVAKTYDVEVSALLKTASFQQMLT